MRCLFIFLIVCAILFIESCHNAESLNPCLEQEPVTARFEMKQWAYSQSVNDPGDPIDTLVVIDTCMTWRSVIFEAEEGYREYEWKIGYDERVFTRRRFSLTFEKELQHIPIQLIVRGTPNYDCFVMDDGVDTLTKYLTVLDRHSDASAPLLGKFRGHLEENPEHEFDVEFSKFYGNRGPFFFYIKNLNEGCMFDPPRDFDFTIGRTYRVWSFSANYDPRHNSYGCEIPKGLIFLSENHQNVKVEFSTQDKFNQSGGEDTKQFHTFIGKRIE